MTAAHDPDAAVLVLEDGTTYRGRAYGRRGTTTGEVVFTTGMSGYQETLTDPSYHRQIVVMTAPHIGNTGVNDEDAESAGLQVAGLVVRDPARRTSSWRATGDLASELTEQGVVGISHLDTRALTRRLRDAGVMRAGIFSGDSLPAHLGADESAALLATVLAEPAMAGADLAREVTTPEAYVLEPSGSFAGTEPRAVVVAIDLGMKAMTAKRLTERGARVHVLPADATYADIAALAPDGVFYSNGPGDPAAATDVVATIREVLDAKTPFFGICFGNQLLGRALGFDTYKLTFGHRGINQPVQDLATGKVDITSHNHGFAVDVPIGEPVTAPHDGGRFGRVEVSHICLNDRVVEGIRALDLPAFAVQYHPEAASGPNDAAHLFDQFLTMMKGA
ncbi:glutamine-hydrolyzing carbamoyl-phosphate synthase small subunit [Pseudactinotalea sp. HY158]|uniref:glutamine-hydrolyzing carbamoyl-phosphate synthase small subunit n=1 Tax=Pseudactinotalea sp. HY158 TaxID=2654547 RepID=UPI00129D2230|nr:glutamine-hydrolyzing carbamoyl-phosphate synthase small subunit [Pseudactinotalea sp. HY158]QGH69372.1 glutamine-hydrolyzing carbamoyl-phosphate synthase small subunit [Pseudactinotalea sp. HY158]